MNITANYFPIGSGIAIEDKETDMQLYVVNDRAQGGSVLKESRMEIMQTRRTNWRDGRGTGENLDELTPNNKTGITVPATYYVQYFNT